MSNVSFPDGSQITSTALTQDQVQTLFQYITAQMLGYVTDPRPYNVIPTAGTITIPVDSTNLLYPGLSFSGPGIASGAILTGTDSVGSTVTLSIPCIATFTTPQIVNATDPNVWAKVKVGWQLQGQPGPRYDVDNTIVRAIPNDTEYSRMHDVTYSDASDGIHDLQIDVYTRAWRVYWTFYGPNALDNARAVRSYLVTVQFVYDFLTSHQLYINPDIKVSQRVPEVFQGQWWDREELEIELNEQVTEVLTIGTVKSVEVFGYTKDGQFMDTTVEAP